MPSRADVPCVAGLPQPDAAVRPGRNSPPLHTETPSMKNQVYLPAGLLAACSLMFTLACPAATPRRAQTVNRPTPAIPSDSLGLLTFNMEHKDRPSELRIMADRLQADTARLPDFILCQEV